MSIFEALSDGFDYRANCRRRYKLVTRVLAQFSLGALVHLRTPVSRVRAATRLKQLVAASLSTSTLTADFGVPRALPWQVHEPPALGFVESGSLRGCLLGAGDVTPRSTRPSFANAGLGNCAGHCDIGEGQRLFCLSTPLILAIACRATGGGFTPVQEMDASHDFRGLETGLRP